jgi:hypothetical protein
MSKSRRDQLQMLLDQAGWPRSDISKGLRLVSSQDAPLSKPERQLSELRKEMLLGDGNEMDRAFMALARIKWPERYCHPPRLCVVADSVWLVRR